MIYNFYKNQKWGKMGKKFEKKATKVEIISKKLIFLNFPPPQKKLNEN